MNRNSQFNLLPLLNRQTYISLGLVMNSGKKCDALTGSCSCGDTHADVLSTSQETLNGAPDYIKEMISGAPVINRPKLYLVKKD